MKLNPQEIESISYDLETKVMKIMNKKGLLIYDKRVSWDFYVKCVNENWQSNINEIEDTKCEDRFSSDELENLRYNDSEDGTLFEELI